MPNTWNEALKEWNKKRNPTERASYAYKIPAKGTKQYEQVMKIKNRLDKKTKSDSDEE